MDGRSEVSGFWTMERIDKLFAMVAEGHSLGDVARVLGCSRNAAIGKWTRTRISRGIHIPQPRKWVAPVSGISGELVRNTTPKRVYTRKQRQPKPAEEGVGFLLPVVVPVAPVSNGVSIVAVTGCRFAVVDDPELPGGMAFCNGPIDGHRMYCARHARIVYTNPPKPQGGMKHRRVPTSLLRAGGF